MLTMLCSARTSSVRVSVDGRAILVMLVAVMVVVVRVLFSSSLTTRLQISRCMLKRGQEHIPASRVVGAPPPRLFSPVERRQCHCRSLSDVVGECRSRPSSVLSPRLLFNDIVVVHHHRRRSTFDDFVVVRCSTSRLVLVRQSHRHRNGVANGPLPVMTASSCGVVVGVGIVVVVVEPCVLLVDD